MEMCYKGNNELVSMLLKLSNLDIWVKDRVCGDVVVVVVVVDMVVVVVVDMVVDVDVILERLFFFGLQREFIIPPCRQT